MSIDLKFVELTADVLKIFFLQNSVAYKLDKKMVAEYSCSSIALVRVII